MNIFVGGNSKLIVTFSVLVNISKCNENLESLYQDMVMIYEVSFLRLMSCMYIRF